VRLFFALWPDDTVRAALADLGQSVAARAQGRAVPSARLHVTLAFLGEVADERESAVREAANAVRASRFQFAVDEVGSFPSARVAWAGLSKMPVELSTLQSSLAGELRDRGFTLEDRAFTAHVTLARRIAKNIAREPVAAIAWGASEFVLVRSETGRGRYSVLERWNLEGRREGR
jgi:2'-5' RNA ligase